MDNCTAFPRVLAIAPRMYEGVERGVFKGVQRSPQRLFLNAYVHVAIYPKGHHLADAVSRLGAKIVLNGRIQLL